MIVFVTVGSTKFDALIASIFTEQALLSFHKNGYTDLVVQCGNSTFEFADTIRNGETVTVSRCGVNIQLWKFKDTLEAELENADLVISHAGSGTILEVLRKGKSMIVVPNPTLLHNHQEELAVSLERMRYLKVANVENLPTVVEEFNRSKIEPFPPFDGSRFAIIVDETMGFI